MYHKGFKLVAPMPEQKMKTPERWRALPRRALLVTTPRKNVLLWSQFVLGWVQRNSYLNFGSTGRRLFIGSVLFYSKLIFLVFFIPFPSFQSQSDSKQDNKLCEILIFALELYISMEFPWRQKMNPIIQTV